MKNLHPDVYNESNNYMQPINKTNLMKYLIMFVIVSSATLIIPTCGVLRSQAMMVGLLASTSFAVIDMCLPNNVLIYN